MANIRAKLFLTLILFMAAIAGYAWFIWMPHSIESSIEQMHVAIHQEDHDFGPLVQTIRDETLTLVGFILFALLFFFWVIGIIVYISLLKPAMHLSRAAKAMAKGDYEMALPIAHEDEIGILISRFGYMREQIRVFTDEILIEKELAEKEVKERKRIESQMQEYSDKLELLRFDADEARRKAEAASEAKTQFLANMSHELRTPMNGIIGLTSLLLDADMNEEDKEALHSIHSSADGLLALLNDILDFSKIEAGELSLEYTPTNIKACIEQVFDMMKPIASRKGLVLELTYSTTAPQYVMADANRIRQILYNLVGNAIKFTDSGHVRVDVSNHRPAAGGSGFCMRIEDTGIGVPDEVKGRIFEKFTQADISTARKYGGTGLGLAITKQLVDMMGGLIGVDSVAGRGSTFWCKIPAEIVEEQDVIEGSGDASGSHHASQQDVENGNILDFSSYAALVVDDHPVNILFAKKLMIRLGFGHVETAHNGVRAIEMFKEKNFDVIVMDCQMPEMDGYEATQNIRALELENAADGETPARVPILALTADAIKGAREKCIDAGMDDYLTKPIDQEKLRTLLAHHLAGHAPLDNDVTQSRAFNNVQRALENAENNTEDVPIDMDHFEMFTDGDPDEEAGLLELFFEQADIGIAELESLLEDESRDDWKKSAHRMKGASANLGAKPLSAVCKEAEFGYELSRAEKADILERIKYEGKRLKSFFESRKSRRDAA